MAPSTIEVVERYSEQVGNDTCDYATPTQRKRRKFRGHGGNRKRNVSLGMCGRNASRSVKRTMK